MRYYTFGGNLPFAFSFSPAPLFLGTTDCVGIGLLTGDSVLDEESQSLSGSLPSSSPHVGSDATSNDKPAPVEKPC